jgi:hypothetical protein
VAGVLNGYDDSEPSVDDVKLETLERDGDSDGDSCELAGIDKNRPAEFRGRGARVSQKWLIAVVTRKVVKRRLVQIALSSPREWGAPLYVQRFSVVLRCVSYASDNDDNNNER